MQLLHGTSTLFSILAGKSFQSSISWRSGTLLLALFIAGSLSLSAQVPANTIGANPLSLKWKQIHTDKVQVIFPQGLEPAGQRVANVVHYLWDHKAESIGEDKQKVTILLQNQTTNSNGFVTVGPFRSEFYMTPPQFNYTTEWLDVLAIHEYRHVQQFGNSRAGLTKLVRSVAGSWAWGGMFGLALPRWYIEGDATVMETALTASGRGRLPAFDMEYRSLLQNDIKYSYEKAAAGSLKDFVPNWYRLGYYMTAYGRREYGRGLWAGVVDDATRFKGLFYPFNKSLKKRTGLSAQELYQKTMQDLENQWEAEEKSATPPTGRPVNTVPKKNITHYLTPQYLNEETLIIEKSGYDRIPRYIKLGTGGREEKIIEPGILLEPLSRTLSLSNGRLCWAELSFDQRWHNKDFSIIRTYDMATKKRQKISSRSKYFSPALSADGKQIVTVEATAELQYSLVILEAESGALLRKLPNPDNDFYSFPRWAEDGRHIVVVARNGERNELQWIEVESGMVEKLTAPTHQQISHPFPKDEYIYFSGAFTGINQIFALKLEDRSITQLTDSPLGAFQPALSPSGQKLAYSEFSPMGYDVIELPLDQALWKPYDTDSPAEYAYAQAMEEQEGGSIVGKVGNERFPVQKFNKWSGLINPHSWLPYLDPPVVGASILSDNKFGTLSMEAGGFYNLNEEEFTFSAGATYAELYPYINASYQISNRSALVYNFSAPNDTTVLVNNYVEEWRENRAGSGLALPLNLTSGNFFNRLVLRADYQRINLDVDGNFDRPNNSRDTISIPPGNLGQLDYLFKAPLENTSLDALSLRLIFRSLRRTALQHINPRLGLNLDLSYRSTFSNDTFQSDVFLGRADLYLPGLGRNHSIVLNGLYQRQDVLDNYRFSNLFFYPRGYNTVFGDEIYKLGFNYHTPLFYPDWALGGLVFLKRVKANAFYDHAWLNANRPFDNSWIQNSAGLELTFDIRLLRLLEIDFGVRYSYLLGDHFLPDGGRHQFDFLLISITE